MNTIDKIRAEIERRIKQWHCSEFVDEMLEGPNGDDGFLSFLDTLEEPVSDDLEEAAENYIAPIENDEGLDYINFNGRDIKDAFKAGAGWQKAKMMEGATYNELMELYRAIRDELVKRHRDVPVNIKEKQ